MLSDEDAKAIFGALCKEAQLKANRSGNAKKVATEKKPEPPTEIPAKKTSTGNKKKRRPNGP